MLEVYANSIRKNVVSDHSKPKKVRPILLVANIPHPEAI